MAQPHAHSHGPQPQSQPMMQPSPDPLVQAALDARFRQVPLKLVPPADRKSTAQVAPADPDSKLDFSALNLLSHQIATMLPANEPVPSRIDPQTVMQNPRSVAVVKAKDEGNVCHVAVQDIWPLCLALSMFRNYTARENMHRRFKCTPRLLKSQCHVPSGRPRILSRTS